MKLLMCPFEIISVEVRIDFRRLTAYVPEDLLDYPQVGASANQVRCE